ncbi:MAG: glycosyltransferase family 2 protein [Elusimicrobia bacterium]|nr:glycosyltransferase family 2 protein [Elusimicrobiota bacterium]
MPSISIVIIAHNEEKNLPRALAGAGWADEIIFVDCASTDSTLALAQKREVKIFQRPNSLAVYVNKQFAMDQASCDWIFILDADEEITAALAAEIREKISDPGHCAAFKLPRKNFYYGKWLKHGGKYPDTQIRLFKKNLARYKPLLVHEKLEISGATGELTNPLFHYPCSDDADFNRKLEFYGAIVSENYFKNNTSVFYSVIRPYLKLFNSLVVKLGILDGKAGVLTALRDLKTLNFARSEFIKKSRGQSPRLFT